MQKEDPKVLKGLMHDVILIETWLIQKYKCISSYVWTELYQKTLN
jgi:hypothetical protein